VELEAAAAYLAGDAGVARDVLLVLVAVELGLVLGRDFDLGDVVLFGHGVGPPWWSAGFSWVPGSSPGTTALFCVQNKGVMRVLDTRIHESSRTSA
jgi:hypothetical protein